MRVQDARHDATGSRLSIPYTADCVATVRDTRRRDCTEHVFKHAERLRPIAACTGRPGNPRAITPNIRNIGTADRKAHEYRAQEKQNPKSFARGRGRFLLIGIEKAIAKLYRSARSPTVQLRPSGVIPAQPANIPTRY